MGYGLQRFVGAIDPNLMCGICSAVLEAAVLAPCGHTFCHACLTTWLARPNTSTCPECRSHVAAEHVKPVHSLRNLINAFDVECDNSERGCKVIVKLERLRAHLATCGYAAVNCAGCSASINRFELAAHQIRCEGIASSVRDEEEDSGEPEHWRCYSSKLSTADMSELIAKIAALEFQVKTVRRDLQISESKNRVLEREFRKAKDELRQKRTELIELNSDFDPCYDYGYSPESIAKLSFLIARFLLKKPSYIDREKIFSAVRRCHDKYARCGSEYEHDVHMLLATAFASNWFPDSCRATLHYWLQGISRYRQMSTNAAKYSAFVKT